MSPLSTQNRIFTVPGSPILKEPPASTAGSSSLAEADSTSRCQGECGVVCLRAKLVFRTDTENTEITQRKIASAQSPRSLRLGGELVIQMRSLDSPLSLSAFSLPHKEFILRWLCFAFNGQGRDGIV